MSYLLGFQYAPSSTTIRAFLSGQCSLLLLLTCSRACLTRREGQREDTLHAYVSHRKYKTGVTVVPDRRKHVDVLEPLGLSVSRVRAARRYARRVRALVGVVIGIQSKCYCAYALLGRPGIKGEEGRECGGEWNGGGPGSNHLNSDKPFWTRRYYGTPFCVRKKIPGPRFRTLIIYPADLATVAAAAIATETRPQSDELTGAVSKAPGVLTGVSKDEARVHGQ